MKNSYTITVLSDRLAICRLPAGDPLPAWAARESLWSVTRTPDEVSVVCPEQNVPAGVRADRGWLPLQVSGPLLLNTTGVLASIVGPLARAGIAIFAISTFETDLVLLREADLDAAREALTRAGHTVR